MKGLVIVLACVFGLAYGQGRTISNTVGATSPQGGRAAGAAGNTAAFANRIVNPLDTTCGTFSNVCYGQGLNAKFVTPVSPVIAQCQAGIASRHGFLLRIDATGQMFITDRFGQNIEDIEFEFTPEQQFGFGGLNAGSHRFGQQHQQQITQQLNAEAAQREVELRCQFNRFGQQIFNA